MGFQQDTALSAQADEQRIPITVSVPAPRLPEPIQTKLKVGTIDGPLDHEADRAVEQVMRMPSPESALTSAVPQVSRKCAECEEEVKLYKKEATAEAAVGEAPASVHEVRRSPGQPLDPAMRGFMEPRFGRDFSGVRVHTDSAAAQSARDVNAHAYTVGSGSRLEQLSFPQMKAQAAFATSHTYRVWRTPTYLLTNTGLCYPQPVRLSKPGLHRLCVGAAPNDFWMARFGLRRRRQAKPMRPAASVA